MLLLIALLAGLGCHDSTAPAGNRPPTVTITSPAPGSSVTQGTQVLLAGTATDPEDGTLTGTSLAWSSSLDGALGSSESLQLTTLSIGTHTVSLTATDDSGATATASRSLRVLGPPGTTLALDTVVQGLNNPVFLTAPPGDLTRLFIVEQGGTIRIVKNGTLLSTPFLNVAGRIVSGGEQGLLGLAFAPDYASSGRFYVSYTGSSSPSGHSVVARYTVSADPDVANTAETVIITQDQPYSNHNGGMIAFGPDGYLYFGLGDGGSGGDPDGHGQDRSELLGSIMRLDVSGNGTYTVPPSNPWAGGASPRPELWNYGLRNPWRFSFDRTGGDLYIADVGQNAWEEVDVQPAASTGGENYGWNVMEGTHCYPSGPCSQTGLTLPVLDYDHGQGCSVTGGYVYRGAAVPVLQGLYLYADYCGGWVRSFRWVNGQATEQQDQPDLSPGENITSFGQDAAGEVYIVTGAGRVYRIALH